MLNHRGIVTILLVSTKVSVLLCNLLECETQRDCFIPERYNCFICANEINGGRKTHCLMLYKKLFINKGVACDVGYRRPNCPGWLKNCNSNGECYNFYVSTTAILDVMYPCCYCRKGFYGNLCEESTPTRDVGSITWLYNANQGNINAFPVGQVSTEQFYIVATDLNKITLFLYGENGYYETHAARYISRSQRCGIQAANTERCYIYYIPIRYPYKAFTGNRSEIFTYKENVLGYEGTLRLKIILNQLVANDYPIKMFVSYNDSTVCLKCIAVITLQDCGDHADLPLIMGAEDHIEVKRQVDYYDDGKYLSKTVLKPECVHDAKTSWKIWRIGKKYRESYEHLNEPFLSELFDSNTLNLPPYTLTPARYKILNEVWVFSKPDEGKSNNFAYCHILIRQVPIEGYFEGSLERHTHKASGITIEVIAADLNRPKSPIDLQKDLEYKWTCKNLNDPNDHLCARILTSTTSTCIIPPNELSPDSVYIFSTTITSRHSYEECDHCTNPLTGNFEVKVTVGSDEPPPEPKYDINIECVRNCERKVSPLEVMVLKVKPVEETESLEYIWSYAKDGEILKPTDNIRDMLSNSDTLSIKPKSLEPGSKYKIVASVVGKPNATAEYMFYTEDSIVVNPIDSTDNESSPMQCHILPQRGVKGFDLFEINCGSYSNYRFEFYDKQKEDTRENVIFSGRMIGTSFNGKLSNMRLTREKVHIYVYNRNGLIFEKRASVTLDPRDYTIEVKNEIMRDLRTMTELGELSRLLGYISIVPDVISYNNVNEVKLIAKALISAFGKAPPANLLADVKLFISTIYNVLSLNNPEPLELLPHRMLLITKTIRQQAAGLNDAIFDKDSSRWLDSSEVQVITKSLLDCLMAAITSRDHKYDNSNEEHIDIYLLDKIKRSTNNVEDTIELLNEMLTYRQGPAQSPTKVASSDNSIILWVMINDKALQIYYMVERYNIPVKIPRSLQRNLEARMRNSEQLNLQVAYMNHNIFWWCNSDVKSNLVSVALAARYKERRLSNIESQNPLMLVLLDLKDNLTETSISGSAIQPDPNLLPFDLDLSLKVHRLDPETRSLIHLRFLFPQTTSSLKVLVSEHFRPDYAIMKNKSFLITAKHPNYTLLEFINRENRTFLYMTILPGPEVNINDAVNYTFEINTKVCQLWVQGYWTSKSCQITSNTTGSTVHCKCSHFSIFAAAFSIPPQEVDPFNHATLFLTFFDNPLVVSFVLAMLLIFFILLLLLCFLDRRDRRIGQVIILNDNYPNYPYPYLIAVHTGSRFCSGTSANVGIKVFGTEDSSRSHVFSCEYRKVLKRNADDWFLIFTSNDLGYLAYIYLWHDNTGSSPDWFCGKIVIYNLDENEETTFKLGEWLALSPDTPLPEVQLKPTKYTDIKDFKRTFLNNCILGLKEGHLFLSVFSRHPRSDINRAQRISLLMTWITVAMLCSIVYYIPKKTDARVDDYSYSVGIKELLISLQSLLLSLIITLTVVFLFRSSYKNRFRQNERAYTLRVRRTSQSWEDDLSRVYLRNPTTQVKSMYQNFVRILSKIMKTRVLPPVTLPLSPPSLQRRTAVYVFAWIVCLTVIIVSAYFVMVYGLKLGAVNSQKWLTSVLLTLSEDIFLTGPFRIVFISVLLSIAYRKLYEANVYDVRYDEAVRSHPPNTEEYLTQLFERRSQRMYVPLVETYILEIVQRSKIRRNWWKLIDFIFALCYLFVLNSAVYRLWTSYYYCNENAKRLVSESHHPRLNSVDFKDVTSIPVAERYLEITFIQAVYSYRWYNGATLKTSDVDYWDHAATSKMFGLPILRELRVETFKCENLIALTGYCTPKWSVFAEDTDSYETGWLPASWNTPYKSAWNYKDQTHSTIATSYRLRGASGSIYHTGGYMTTLGPKRQQAENTLSELRAYHWQDHRTRAVFLELTLYNVNLDMFSHVTLMVEYLVSHTVMLSTQVTSVKGYESTSFWGLPFIVIIVIYSLRIAYLVNRHGLLYNLTRSSHALRIIVVLLALSCVVFDLIHYFTSKSFVRKFRGQENTNFDFDSFTLVFRSLQITLSVLICVAIVMFFTLVRGGRTFFTQVFIFVISWTWICWLTSILVLFYLFLSRSYLLWNIVMQNGGSLDIFHPKAVNTRAPEDLESFIVELFLIVKTIIFFVFYSMFMLTFLHFSMVAKGYKFIRSHKLNFITFLYERLSRKKEINGNKL